MLAQEAVPLIEQGSIQFILFGLMMIGVFVVLWFTISK
jgi:hypothetical protein